MQHVCDMVAPVGGRRYSLRMQADERAELMGRGLRRVFDGAGGILREKPARRVRMFARLARKRARLGLEAIARGDLFEAGSLFGWAGDAMAVATDLRKESRLAPAARRGQPFLDGPKRPRRDALARLIDNALAQGPNFTAKELLTRMNEIDDGRVIQEIGDDLTIIWRAGPLDERETTFRSLQNRISDRRKKIAPM